MTIYCTAPVYVRDSCTVLVLEVSNQFSFNFWDKDPTPPPCPEQHNQAHIGRRSPLGRGEGAGSPQNANTCTSKSRIGVLPRVILSERTHRHRVTLIQREWRGIYFLPLKILVLFSFFLSPLTRTK